jgi:hypothetical protein
MSEMRESDCNDRSGDLEGGKIDETGRLRNEGRASGMIVTGIWREDHGKETENPIIRGRASIFTYLEEVGVETEEETWGCETSESSRIDRERRLSRRNRSRDSGSILPRRTGWPFLFRKSQGTAISMSCSWIEPIAYCSNCFYMSTKRLSVPEWVWVQAHDHLLWSWLNDSWQTRPRPDYSNHS